MKLYLEGFQKILFLIFCIYAIDSQAQSYPKIEGYIQSGRYDLALAEAKRELSYKNDPLLNYYLGISYLESDFGKFKSLSFLETACQSQNPKPIYFFDLGRAYHAMGKWQSAVVAFNEFREKIKQDSEYYRKATQLINACTTALNLSKKENVYQTFVFSPYINTSYDEFKFLFIPRQKDVFLSSNRRYNSYQDIISQTDFLADSEKNSSINFYRSAPKDDNQDTTANWSLTSEQKIRDFKGFPVSVAADGETYLFLGSYKDRQAEELYIIKLNEKKEWGKPHRLPNSVNSGGKYWGATFVDAGRSIIFASDRAGGYGGFDLYRVDSKRDRWETPRNLGPAINTSSDEVTPFMGHDNQTLYFSSDRVGSIGGLDVFFSKDSVGLWCVPQNMGLGINSSADEIYYSTKPGSDHVVFSSNRVTEQSMGGYDIYFASNLRPQSRIAIVTGNIVALRGTDTLNVSIKITSEDSLQDRRSHPIVYNSKRNGEYVAFLPQAKNYMFTVHVGNSHFYKFRITIEKDTRVYRFSQNIEVKKIALLGNEVVEHLSLSTPIYSFDKMDKTGNGFLSSVSRTSGFRKMVEEIFANKDSASYASLDGIINDLDVSPEQREQYRKTILQEIQDAFKDPQIDFNVFDKIGTLQGQIFGNEGVWKIPPDSVIARLQDPFVPGSDQLSQIQLKKLEEIITFVNDFKNLAIFIVQNESKIPLEARILNKTAILQNYFKSRLKADQHKIMVTNSNLAQKDIIIEVKKLNR